MEKIKLNNGVVMTNMDNISKIEYYSSSGELLKTYTDCKAIKKLSKEYSKEYEDGKFSDVYTVVAEVK